MKEKIYKICTQLNDGQIAVTEATEQLLDLFGVSGSLHPLTPNKVDKMMKDISLETFLACGGNKHEWKEWWSKRNAVNVNSNDR
jgi:hypothetical protein